MQGTMRPGARFATTRRNLLPSNGTFLPANLRTIPKKNRRQAPQGVGMGTGGRPRQGFTDPLGRPLLAPRISKLAVPFTDSISSASERYFTRDNWDRIYEALRAEGKATFDADIAEKWHVEPRQTLRTNAVPKGDLIQRLYAVWKVMVSSRLRVQDVLRVYTRAMKRDAQRDVVFPPRIECAYPPTPVFIKLMLNMTNGYRMSSEQGRIGIEWEILSTLSMTWRQEILPNLVTEMGGALKDAMITEKSTLDDIIKASCLMYEVPIMKRVIESGGVDVIMADDHPMGRRWGVVDPAFFFVQNGDFLLTKPRLRKMWMKASYLHLLAPEAHVPVHREQWKRGIPRVTPEDCLEFAKKASRLDKNSGVFALTEPKGIDLLESLENYVAFFS